MTTALHPLSRLLCVIALALSFPASSRAAEPALSPLLNADFETGNLTGWKDWRLRRAEISKNAHAGQYAVALGPESARCVQEIKIRSNSRYRLSAWVKTESGAEQVELIAQEYGGPTVSVASALTEYTKVMVEFTSAHTRDSASIMLRHRAGPGKGYVDSIELEYLGEAPEPTVQEFVTPAVPEQKSEGGVTTLPESQMKWYLDAKFGMFIHWGVYSAIDKGAEWVMHTKAAFLIMGFSLFS
jgi:alpha-L-fucosidase